MMTSRWQPSSLQAAPHCEMCFKFVSQPTGRFKMSHTCPEGMIMRACQHPMMVLAKSLWNITCLNHLVVLDAKIEMRSSETFNPLYTISKKFCLSSF